jgi:ATPase family associated with various cellular activities (AAA)
MFQAIRMLTGKSQVNALLRKHFQWIELTTLVTAARRFPSASRVDVQVALDDFLQRYPARLLGIHSGFGHETVNLAHLLTRGSPFPVDVGPLQHDEVDIGEPDPVRCLKMGLWLSSAENLPFAILLSPAFQYGAVAGIQVEIGVPPGEVGLAFSQSFFREIEKGVNAGRTYRGRVISLETGIDFAGRGGTVKVHRLHQVAREDVVLPDRTLSLLDRNVSAFIGARDRIKSLGLSAKKGLLFYGPPGTGKTHTIHYLASQLPGHTTLLITAEQVGLLSEYFRLARFLQPSVMIVEDVDLIARERTHMGNPGQEMLLNKLLNEMDGLREDADVIFILTTNRPDQLEPALAARPGRIDQAIEFPLPDADGRAKLVRLYSRSLSVPDDVVSAVVQKTKGTSAAFIKELMRRSAQFQFEVDGGDVLHQRSVDAALEEMLFTGGSLNAKLLGAEAADILGGLDTSSFPIASGLHSRHET